MTFQRYSVISKVGLGYLVSSAVKLYPPAPACQDFLQILVVLSFDPEPSKGRRFFVNGSPKLSTTCHRDVFF